MGQAEAQARMPPWPENYARGAIALASSGDRAALHAAWESFRRASSSHSSDDGNPAGRDAGRIAAWRGFVSLLDERLPGGAIRFGMHAGNPPASEVMLGRQLPAAVIFDMDGTLTDVSAVRHYVRADRKHRNYAVFHRASAVCPPNPRVLEAARSCPAAVVVVTARGEEFRIITAGWLRKWRVPYAELRMRPERDNRPDTEVKADILNGLLTRWRIERAWDDNPGVIRLWRSRGIPVTEVPGWE